MKIVFLCDIFVILYHNIVYFEYNRHKSMQNEKICKNILLIVGNTGILFYGKSFSKRGFVKMSEDERFVLDLVINHKVGLMKIITSKLGPYRTNDMEDCLQDIFVLVLLNLEKLKNHPNPVGWLYVTASNVAYDTRRKNIKHEQHTIPFGDVVDFLGEDDIEPFIDDFQFDSGEETEDHQKRKVLDELSDREKDLYRLKYVEKKDTKYLAEYYSTTEGCIRARLSQLRKHVRKIVEKQMK